MTIYYKMIPINWIMYLFPPRLLTSQAGNKFQLASIFISQKDAKLSASDVEMAASDVKLASDVNFTSRDVNVGS